MMSSTSWASVAAWAKASGPTVRHVYQSAGTHQVRLTADDGQEGTTSASVTLTSRTLDGEWLSQRGERFECVQDGPALDSRVDWGSGEVYLTRWVGTLVDPRTVDGALFINTDPPD